MTPDVTPATDSRPLYARLLDLLRRRWQAGGCKPFFAAHRALAADLGCSAGALPDLMRRAEDDGILIRRRAGRTHRLVLIDQRPRAFAIGMDALIDQAPEAAVEAEVPPEAPPTPAAEAAPSAAGRPEPALINSDLPHVDDHDSRRGVGDARARVATESPAQERRFAALGFHPTSIPLLLRSGIAPDRVAAWLDLKIAERARNPHGVIVAALRSGHRVVDWRQQQEEASRGTEHQPSAPARARRGPDPDRPGRPAGRWAAPPPRTPVAQPAPDFASIDELGPGWTLEQLLRGDGPGALHAAAGGC